jgi:hypothetical protein
MNLNRFQVSMAAVALLALQAVVINRLAGLPYPLWAPRKVASQHAERP